MAKTYVRGIRGAITVERNTAEDIIQATGELLQAIMAENDLTPRTLPVPFLPLLPILMLNFRLRQPGNCWGGNMYPFYVPGKLMCLGACPGAYGYWST